MSPTKKNTKNEKPANPLDGVESAPLPNENTETDLVGTDGDFAQLFGDGSDNVTVQLQRIAPAYHNNIKIAGFIRYLNAGEDIGSISNQYGGGTYMVRKLVNGKFSEHRRLSISGNPKTDIPPTSLTGIDNVGSLNDTGLTDYETTEIDGVKVGGSDAAFMRMVRQIKLYKELFPERETINDTLMKIVLSQKNGGGFESILNNVDKIGTLVDRLAPAGGGSGNTNWMDLAQSAIKAFSQFVQKAGQNQPGIARPVKMSIDNPAVTRQISENDDVGSPGNSDIITRGANQMTTENSEPIPLTREQIIEKACSYIVGGFIQDPLMPVKDTVLVMKNVLPAFDQAGLDEIYGNKKSLLLVGKSILSNSIATDIDIIEKYSLYFNNVIDIFCLRSETLNEQTQKNESEAENGQKTNSGSGDQ